MSKVTVDLINNGRLELFDKFFSVGNDTVHFVSLKILLHNTMSEIFKYLFLTAG